MFEIDYQSRLFSDREYTKRLLRLLSYGFGPDSVLVEVNRAMDVLLWYKGSVTT